MRLLAPQSDFAYGNARLRARKAGLLGRADYEDLISKDIEAILGSLSRTPLGPEVEAALTRYGGARRVHEAVRLHLARSLEEMRSFYTGRAKALVDLLLSCWDLHNVLTLLREEAVAPHTEEGLAHVFPMGAMTDAYAREIARQNEFAAAVGLMIRWRLPDPETARSLSSAWPDYERTEDFAALEHAVIAAWSERTAAALEALEPEGEPLRRLFRRETDEKNLLIALRLREALARGETDSLPQLEGHGVYQPGGGVAPKRFDEGIRLPDDARVAASLAAAGPAAWREPLERWAHGGRLPDLQHDLEARRVRDAVGLRSSSVRGRAAGRSRRRWRPPGASWTASRRASSSASSPKPSSLTVWFGVGLVLIGVLGYVVSGAASITALIPAAIGVLMLGAGALMARTGLRSVGLALAVVLAALLAYGSTRGVAGLLSGDVSASTVISSFLLVVSIAFVVVAVRKALRGRRTGRGATPA